MNLIFLKILYYSIISVVVLTIVSCNSKGQNGTKPESQTNISFKIDLYDFGKIPAKKEATAIFKFSNTGNNPLIITEVKTSCGCTVPEYTKDIIKPDKTGEIKVVYDAKYPGRFNKTVTVYYNGKDSPKKLTIKGEVPYPKELDSID